MKKKTLIIILVALLIIVGFTFYSAVIKGDNQNTPREEAIEEDDSRPEIVIPTKHQYKDGEHIFVSTLDLPSPCHSFNAEIVDMEENKSEIKFSINDPGEDEVCTQVITPRDVKVTKEASEDHQFEASLNGESASLNIFEVDSSEDIDTIELFIKG